MTSVRSKRGRRQGIPGARAKYAELVRRARAAGEGYRTTCERLEISSSYYYELVNDPGGVKVAARKDSYRRPCPRCGTLMTGSNGFNGSAPKLCTTCQHREKHDSRVWTGEAIIEAIRYFAAVHGRPPVAAEFTPALNGRRSPRRALDYQGSADYPNFSQVAREFGTWSAAIEAAGFDPRRVGDKVRGFIVQPGRPRSFDWDEALRLHEEEGVSGPVLAERYGVSRNAIYSAFKKLRKARRAQQ